MAAVAASSETALAAALLWAGDAVGGGRSAGEVYGLEGVRPRRPEIVVPGALRARNSRIVVRHARNRDALMVRTHRGFRVTGVEATLVALAASLDGEAFEIACEDARRRRLTSVAALHAYLDRFGKRGMPGVAATRQLLDELDPVHPSKSTLEVKMRRLLVADGCTDFVREFPLTWNGRTRFYDFAFTGPRVILETNGRRWHDDPNDYEDDQEKWSIPGRLGYRLVFATYDKVTQRPDDLLRELTATLAA
jgi:very-short-patch-repair endonuclease